MTRERSGNYKKFVLEILRDHQSGMHYKDLFEELEKRMPATEFENGIYESSKKRRRPYIVRFASISLFKAQWLAKDQGIWFITEEGRKALDRYKTADEIYLAVKSLYGEWKASRPDETEGSEDNQDIQARASIEEAEEEAFAIIAQHMGEMDPYDFQELVGALLRAMGYFVSWIAPPGKDGGMDVVAFQDPLGANGRRIKVQVKRRADKAGVESLSAFLGVLGDEDIGLYICTGGFSPDAERKAREQEKKRIRLLDAKALFDLWIEHYEKLPQQDRSRMPLKPIYHLDI